MPCVLSVPPAICEKIVANPVNFKTNPWHVDARHRYRDDLDNWKLHRIEVYKDSDRKSFPFVSPNTSVAKFIEKEGMHPVSRNNTLPC